jgi:alpha-tubulin suppressor-like RCC1 family protein
MFGFAQCGQLGLGEDCIDRAFKPEKVMLDQEEGTRVESLALGDSHSLILTSRGHIFAAGANDKYQLGLDPE